MTEEFRLLLEAKLKAYHDSVQGTMIKSCRLVQYCENRCKVMDVPLGKIEEEIRGCLAIGSNVDWALRRDRLYLRVYDGGTEWEPAWDLVFFERNIPLYADGKEIDTEDEFDDRPVPDPMAARATLPLTDDNMEDLFEALNEASSEPCEHDYRVARAWLTVKGLPIESVLTWLKENRGDCDCEALMNSKRTWQDGVLAEQAAQQGDKGSSNDD